MLVQKSDRETEGQDHALIPSVDRSVRWSELSCRTSLTRPHVDLQVDCLSTVFRLLSCVCICLSKCGHQMDSDSRYTRSLSRSLTAEKVREAHARIQAEGLLAFTSPCSRIQDADVLVV